VLYQTKISAKVTFFSRKTKNNSLENSIKPPAKVFYGK
jgi:hypothetical protein